MSRAEMDIIIIKVAFFKGHKKYFEKFEAQTCIFCIVYLTEIQTTVFLRFASYLVIDVLNWFKVVFNVIFWALFEAIFSYIDIYSDYSHLKATKVNWTQ